MAAVAGELLWIFGIPMTREDDALRAVRAAHEMRGQIGSVGEGEGRELSVRLEIAGGEVIAAGTSDLFGAPLEQGLFLARLAAPGDVLLDETTRRATLSTVVSEPAGEGGEAYRFLGLAITPATPARDLPMIGRDRELERALDVFHQAVTTGETHLLTIVGEAGIGKSRLARELTRRVGDAATVLTGRCLSYGEGVAFWPWREALPQVAGGESEDALRALLSEEPDGDAVANIIATTLRLAKGETVGEQVPWAFRRLLEILSARRPVVLVLEDAHWRSARPAPAAHTLCVADAIVRFRLGRKREAIVAFAPSEVRRSRVPAPRWTLFASFCLGQRPAAPGVR